MHDNYVKIFDTTLRDGEQSPGATMTTPEKLEIARMLSRLFSRRLNISSKCFSVDHRAQCNQRITQQGARNKVSFEWRSCTSNSPATSLLVFVFFFFFFFNFSSFPSTPPFTRFDYYSTR